MSGGRWTVLVTGGAGLIGSAVCRQLAATGARVVAVDDFSIGRWTSEGVEWRRADVCSDSIVGVLDAVAPQTVVHAAAHPGGRSLQEPVLDVQVNVLGSMRVFDWCARNRAHVVYLSSSVIYGQQPPGPIPETARIDPGTIYGVCKVACEQAVQVLQTGYGLQWTVLRLFATYGAGHLPSLHQGIVNVMLTQMLAGSRVVVRGSLERVRDLVYVDDAAAATVAAAATPAARGRILNVGTGQGVTIRTLIDELARALGRAPAFFDVIQEAGTPGDPASSVADYTAARDVLGYQPHYTLAAGLRELVRARSAVVS